MCHFVQIEFLLMQISNLIAMQWNFQDSNKHINSHILFMKKRKKKTSLKQGDQNA